MVELFSNEDSLSLLPLGLFIPMKFVLDHFLIDPAMAPNNAIEQQLVTLFRLISSKERAQILDPLMRSKFYCDMFHSFRTFPLFFEIFCVRSGRCCFLSVRTGWCTFKSACSWRQCDTSGDESETSQPHSCVRSKRRYKMKKAWGQMNWAGFFWLVRFLWGLLVNRDREYPFAKDLIVDDSGTSDAALAVLAKLSSLIEGLRLGGSYELVNQLWAQFTLTASSVNVDVMFPEMRCWLVFSLVYISTYLCDLAYWCCVLVNHFEWDVPPHPLSWVWVGELAPTLQHWFWRARFRDLGDAADVRRAHI